MHSYRRTLSVAVAALACVVAAPASAQFTVFDPTNYAQTLITAKNSIEQVSHALTQIQQLQSQLQNQVLMLQGLKTDITGPIAQITGQATAILQQAQGLGYTGQNIAQQFASLYPSSMAGASFASTQASYAAWRQENAGALQQALEMQNRIAQGQPTTAAQVAAAVQASQGAPGQTAALQATNQLLATVSAQLTQLQNLLITQARAEQTLTAQMQAAQAAGQADSTRAWTYTPPPSRVQNPGQL